MIIKPVTQRAPMKAAATVESGEVRTLSPPEANITMATPSPAPELIPRISGPANGLPKAVCNMSPDAANAAPANSAVTAAGMRDWVMMNCHAGLTPSWPDKMATVSLNGMCTEPMKRLAANRNSTASTASSVGREL